MMLFLRILTFFLFCSALGFAADLEIKVDQKSIKLPYWPNSKLQYGGVIIINGTTPTQWSDALSHLAELLAQNGWSTVLLNVNPEVKVPWIKQVPEAIGALRKDKNKRIVLIHYGQQLNITLDYFSKPQAKGINGLVLLSATDDKPITAKPSSFRFPLFDIDGQFDYEDVQSQMKARSTTFESATYLSLEIPGANNQYDYTQELLVSFLTGWMLKIPESSVAAPPLNTKTATQSYIAPIYILESQLIAINHLF